LEKIITDKSGQDWYVESPEKVVVKQCPCCGKPLQATTLEASPSVSHIIFRGAEGQILGAFDMDATKIPLMGLDIVTCQFCGYNKR